MLVLPTSNSTKDDSLHTSTLDEPDKLVGHFIRRSWGPMQETAAKATTSPAVSENMTHVRALISLFPQRCI